VAVTPIAVAACSIAPVKGLRLERVPRVLLERDGVRGDRLAYVIDARGRMVNGKNHGALQQVRAGLDESGSQLTLDFPGGTSVSGPLRTEERVETMFFSLRRDAVVVAGPFAQALSRHFGEPVRLVLPADARCAIDRGPRGAVTLISTASLAALAELAGGELDPRRFRMSLEVSGTAPFEEDSWLGRELGVGEAVLRPEGHVGRCLVTSRDPDSGEIDVPTLELLRRLRAGAEATEPLPFGVHCAVVRPGAVNVGDAVELRGA
jgi:uncharacterized protein